MWKNIWTKEFWSGMFELFNLIVSLALFIMGAWVGIFQEQYALGAFLLILAGYGRGKL